MSTESNAGRTWVTIGLLGLLGGGVTAATWVGGEHSLAIMLGAFYLVCCLASYLWSRGRGDVAAMIRLSSDERQRLIDTRATAVAGLVTLAFCVGGAIVNLARGGTGNPWALICSVGGASYAAALAVLLRRD